MSSKKNKAAYSPLGALVSKIEGGGTPSKEVPGFWDGDIPLLTIKDLPNARLGLTVDRITTSGLESSSSKIVPAGIPVIATRMDVGRVVRCPVPVAINQDLRAIYPDPDKVDVDYIVQVLPTLEREFRRYSCGSTVMGIGIDDLKSVKIYLPPLAEQRKIAEILRTWDEAIETAEAELKAKQERKRWMVNQLLGSLPGAKTFRMSDLFERVVRRNSSGCTMSLTISASAGLVDQREVFSRKITSTDTSKYFLVKKGEYAYNRSHSIGNPYGVIRRLSRYEEGIVSPIYLVFKSRSEEVEPLYADMLFESGGLNKELRKIAQEGARAHGLLNVAAEDFFSMKVSLPGLAKQRENAERLSIISQEIEINSELVNSLREQKRGLMQKLLTGEVRVAV